MSVVTGRSSLVGPLPPAGSCPGCTQAASGERCTHCGVAVRVGPYRVRQVLGQRGAARTYLADDADGLVVLKELSFSSEPSAATLQAFHQEARQLQGLTHPRVPRYLDLLQLGLGSDTRLYLVQEFIEGTPLETELAGRHSTEIEARELARQVLDILRYLQSRSPQVFHGDLKPANLIRRADGALFLVDFGAAWVRGGTSSEASRYTPPEQTHGELDAATDLFGLGVTLVDALSWDPAWKQQKLTPTEKLAASVDVTPAFRDFLARLTAADPALRFASAPEALRELDAPEQPLRPPARRLKRAALAAGAAVLIFGAGYEMGRRSILSELARSELQRPPTPPLGTPLPAPAPRTARGSTAPASLPPPDTADTVSYEEPTLQVREELAPVHQPRNCEFAGYAHASASGSYERGEASAAFDRDPATAWRSNQSTGAWVQVDLGRDYTLTAMVLSWAWDTRFGASAKSIVSTSLDGQRWSQLHSVINEPQDNNIPRRVWFPQRVARYVRFTGTDWHGGWAHVRSFELYGPECPLDPPSAVTDTSNGAR
jgi:serine/threonine protein kinase